MMGCPCALRRELPYCIDARECYETQVPTKANVAQKGKADTIGPNDLQARDNSNMQTQLEAVDNKLSYHLQAELPVSGVSKSLPVLLSAQLPGSGYGRLQLPKRVLS